MGERVSRRVVVTRFGGPEVLEVVRGPVPEPRRGEVRVRVTRCGVAFGDLIRRRGVLVWRPGFTPGYDVVGVVEAGDPGWEGARVACLLPTVGLGGYAEHVCVPTRDLVRIPAGVDDDTAIALVLNYVTAWQIVHRVAHLRPGQRLLVQGASGGVGTALLDVGRHAGLVTFGTASAAKHDVVRRFGAEPFDYRAADVAEQVRLRSGGGVDAVADPIGGASLDTSHATLAPGGTLVFFGFTGDVDKGLWGLLQGFLRVARLWFRPGRRVRSYGITVPPASSRASCRDDLERVLGLAGAWTPLVGARFELAEAAEAHRALESGAGVGKTVLFVDAEAR